MLYFTNMKNFVLYIGSFKLKCLQKEIRFELNFFFYFSNKNCALILVKGFSHLEPSFTKIWPFIKKKKFFLRNFAAFAAIMDFQQFSENLYFQILKGNFIAVLIRFFVQTLLDQMLCSEIASTIFLAIFVIVTKELKKS